MTSDKKSLLPQLQSALQDTEKVLLERLKSSTSDNEYFRWMLFIVGYYRGVKKVDSATALLKSFLETSFDDEQKAHCHLALGQIAIDEQKLETALSHFRTALGLHPKKKKVTYVLLNNSGYCLNKLGRYSEGERYCRMAIEFNWKRASGYRNLGVSLEGQGNLVGAAWMLMEALKADATDPSARALLQKLLAEHPGLVVHCPWIAQGLNSEFEAFATPPIV